MKPALSPVPLGAKITHRIHEAGVVRVYYIHKGRCHMTTYRAVK